MTGATGFIGKPFCEWMVNAGHELVALMREPARARECLPSPYDAYRWDLLAGPPVGKALEGVDWVFHLAGEPVGEGRWNRERRKRIRDSRVLGTRNLIEGIGRMKGRKPSVLVAASAIGYYGDRGSELLTEGFSPGKGFLSEVCVEWERELARASELGLRVVTLRFGMVIGKEGGALQRMLPVFQKGLGGRLGDGSQWVSWIHQEDAVRLIEFAASHPELKGALNAVSPGAIRQFEFASALARTMGKPARLSVPAFALRLLLGDVSCLALESQRVSSARALASGFRFKYERLEDALSQVLTEVP